MMIMMMMKIMMMRVVKRMRMRMRMAMMMAMMMVMMMVVVDRSQGREADFVRACAVETHMDISQEPFCVEIYRVNAGRV